jgi:hypothetical protein
MSYRPPAERVAWIFPPCGLNDSCSRKLLKINRSLARCQHVLFENSQISTGCRADCEHTCLLTPFTIMLFNHKVKSRIPMKRFSLLDSRRMSIDNIDIRSQKSDITSFTKRRWPAAVIWIGFYLLLTSCATQIAGDQIENRMINNI